MGPSARAPLAGQPDIAGFDEELDVSGIITEDERGVANFGSEKQMRLLTEPLYASWRGPPPLEDGLARPFVAVANVGLFPALKEPPLVPDVFLSVDVQTKQDLWPKSNRTYFFWEFGKPPDVVIEVVSNREGDELGAKKRRYARMRIAHYVVWDPAHHLGTTDLRTYELRGDLFVAVDEPVFEALGLRLVLWQGAFEGVEARWLRWADASGAVVPTGAERAEAERQRAEAERQRAEAERQRAEAERQRADLAEQQTRELRERLRKAGIDPGPER